MYKKYILSIAALFLAVLWALPVSAAEFKSGESVTLSSADDDVYAAGANIFADGEINGDLYAAGAVLRCNANVNHDAVMAGSIVDLFGNVGDDARLAGSMVTIGGTVEDDVMAFGGMVRVLPGAVIKGDLVVGGGSVIIDGKVEGNVLGGAGQMVLQGEVLGSVITEVEELQLGSSANINGVLQYVSINDAEIDESAVVGLGVEHKMPERGSDVGRREVGSAEVSGGVVFGLWLLFLLVKILIAGITILVALHFFKKHIATLTKEMMTKFPAQFGWGFVWTIIIPIASLVLIFTLLGAVIGVFGLVVYCLFMIIAKLLAMIALGSWLWKVFTKSKTYEVNWKIALIGVVVMCLISSIPVIGCLFMIVFVLAAMGSVVEYFKNAVK